MKQQGDGLPWPCYRAQQELIASLMTPEEQRAARERAQLLVAEGWGALQDWLQLDPAAALPKGTAAADPLADLFDAA